MITATLDERPVVVDILTRSFESNRSVNYVIKQDNQKIKRIQQLMEYSFNMCSKFGDVFLSEDKKGCALILYPDKKKADFQSLIWDLKLAFSSIGISNISKALKRESEIKKRHPADPFAYLWFIGVSPVAQHSGIGSRLLEEILQHAIAQNRSVFLETSTECNLPWYKKFGFEVYDELDLGYRLIFLKRT